MKREEKPVQYRKIQLSSSQTRLVSLPRDWAERNKIEKDSVIIIRELPNDTLLLTPANRPLKKKPIKLPDSKRIHRDLLRAYLDGFDKIEIFSSQGPLKRRDQIHEVSRNLIGLEILEEDSGRIEIHFLIEPSPTLDPLLLIRRCFSIAAGMERDTIQAILTNDSSLFQSVIKRDDEVDRLYFLIVRILKTVTHQISENTSFQLVDALNLRMLASHAESMADQVESIAKRLSERLNEHLIPDLEKTLATHIKKLADQMASRLNLAIDAYVERNVDAASELIDQLEELDDDLDLLEKELEEKSATDTYRVLSSVIGLLRRNRELIEDVADLVS